MPQSAKSSMQHCTSTSPQRRVCRVVSWVPVCAGLTPAHAHTAVQAPLRRLCWATCRPLPAWTSLASSTTAGTSMAAYSRCGSKLQGAAGVAVGGREPTVIFASKENGLRAKVLLVT